MANKKGRSKIKHQKTSEATGNKFNYPIPESNYSFDYPVFCFKYLHRNYNLDKCCNTHKKDLVVRLSKLAELGFEEIEKSGRHQFGNEKIKIKSLKIQLPNFITDDVDFLYAYRYHGKNPFLVYRRPNTSILHIIAIDYNFTVYNHGK